MHPRHSIKRLDIDCFEVSTYLLILMHFLYYAIGLASACGSAGRRVLFPSERLCSRSMELPVVIRSTSIVISEYIPDVLASQLTAIAF